MPNDRKEIIKLLFDWNKWLVAVQTAAIAALGFLTKTGTNKYALVFGALTIIFFVLAIVLSSFFLLNLPYLIEEKETESKFFTGSQRVRFTWLWQRQKWWPFDRGPWRVGTFTTHITRFFLIGILLFSLTFICALLPI